MKKVCLPPPARRTRSLIPDPRLVTQSSEIHPTHSGNPAQNLGGPTGNTKRLDNKQPPTTKSPRYPPQRSESLVMRTAQIDRHSETNLPGQGRKTCASRSLYKCFLRNAKPALLLYFILFLRFQIITKKTPTLATNDQQPTTSNLTCLACVFVFLCT